MHTNYIIFVLILVCLAYSECSSLVNNKTMQLHEDLLSHYNVDIRPCVGCAGPLPINLSFYLNSLNELDEVHGEMHSVGYLIVMWVEDRMTWNPADYGGVISVVLPITKVCDLI